MEFHLAARDVDTRAVVDAIAAEFPLDATVASQRWSGFLRGFVDLVYRVRGHWYLLDWKSNRLGARVEAYDQPAMARANAANAYPLQFCLYALALHRLLRARLPGYSYDEHFGGVRYVYLRGVSAQSVPAAGSRPGVYVARPSPQLVDRLDALFGGGR
jgi:exodeoxyribonuclease V beta subunit